MSEGHSTLPIAARSLSRTCAVRMGRRHMTSSQNERNALRLSLYYMVGGS
ncbi:unnamed protein product [Staurois parvus]|uniref:Uncharacterized protein n=1 Tax=Staurois parvus TaxID=386267 RepID=A0ABN9AXW5_9NEOB|nr:unnamed protein product [Staurois parvus]